jgi:hypothetical protein
MVKYPIVPCKNLSTTIHTNTGHRDEDKLSSQRKKGSVAKSNQSERPLYMLQAPEGVVTATWVGEDTSWSISPKTYRPEGSRYISVSQASNLLAAVRCAELTDLPLNAHVIIHFVGTNIGDDAYGVRFAAIRKDMARWLRRRGIPITAVWCREKKPQSDVVHAHMAMHVPEAWLTCAKLVHESGSVKGSPELLQLEASLNRSVKGVCGWTDDYVVRVKIPTDGGKLGPYNGRSYDGLYLLKGGNRDVRKLVRAVFPHSKFRLESQGVIFGKRCGTTQNIGYAARAWSDEAQGYEAELYERASDLGLKLRELA